MKKPILILALCATFGSHVFGGINETYQQAIARYGKPVQPVYQPTKDSEAIAVFYYDGIKIFACYYAGHCNSISFSKVPLDGSSPPMAFTEAEKEKIRRAYATSWVLYKDPNPDKVWGAKFPRGTMICPFLDILTGLFLQQAGRASMRGPFPQFSC